ncbi:MAG: GH92 family glycosyl hydrolase [Tannerella sp.]|jgi:predicted alpha-1,2-mannosidase|nr:GH92 family glycosyl hydrolase [Tannerella sp.]
MKRFLVLFVIIALQAQAQTRLSDYVDPFVGATTQGYEAGKTFPGAASPFGLVQVSPNTIYGGDNGSGYSYEHESVEGFALTQMSGCGWGGDLGNFLVLPATGEMKLVAGTLDNPDEGYRSRFNKQTETARAGYYSAELTDYGVKAEMTCSPHAGFFRFTYPENRQSRIQIDLTHRVAGTSALQKVRRVGDNAIEGYIVCTPKEGGWGYGNGKAEYTLHFYAVFSKPLKNYGVWSANIPDGHPRKMDDVLKDDYQQLIKDATIIRDFQGDIEGKHLGFFTEFETKAGEQVLMKVGVSFVSEKSAAANLNAEIADMDFDGAYERNRAAWDKALATITVKGGSEKQKRIFYSALYHVMIDPRLVADVDGKYPGGDGQIHETSSFNKRMFFSGWDVFRSQMPLLTIIAPQIVSDMLNSLITLAKENGSNYLCRWVFFNSYSDECMVGNPTISVIYDAYAKGIRNFDIDKAYRFGVNTSKIWGNERLGFMPDTVWRGSVSTTLEYAYTEWCMAQLAKALGKKDDYKKYIKLSKSYRNVWNDSIKWFWPKNEKGEFLPYTKRGRLHENYGAVECNPFQQGWFVPHDIPGLVKLIGGKDKTLKELDYLFANTPADFSWNEFYNHSNEPVHHIPFLYNRLGEPWKTQRWSRFICDNAYKEGIHGIIGNEDLGQMSAWYVLAASGIHPVCPGETRFELTSPVFDEICFNLPSGKTFIIKAINNSPTNIYIQSSTLNGKKYNKYYLEYGDIMKGGMLELQMGGKPMMSAGGA